MSIRFEEYTPREISECLDLACDSSVFYEIDEINSCFWSNIGELHYDFDYDFIDDICGGYGVVSVWLSIGDTKLSIGTKAVHSETPNDIALKLINEWRKSDDHE
ncbi:hypothetical protein VPH159E362A_0056 [Vibrio phage 159E36-2a]